MDRLPNEVLHLLVAQVSQIQYHTDGYAPTTELKNLRLTTRTFGNLVPEFLYHDVVLYMTDDSFAKLKCLAEHPTYALMVHRLTFFASLLEDRAFEDQVHYETVVKAIEYFGEDGKQWGFDAEGHRELSQETLDAGYAHWKHYSKAEMEMRLRAEDLLSDAMKSLTNLCTLSPGFPEEILGFPDAMRNCWGPVPAIARMTLMSDVCQGWTRERLPVENTVILINALARSVCPVRGLYLYNDYGGFEVSEGMSPLSSPLVMDAAQQVAQYLHSLHLPLLADGTEDTSDKSFCSRLLGWTVNLSDLNIVRGPPDGTFLDMTSTFGTVHMPRLKWLHIECLATSSRLFIQFLDRHKATLETVSLDGFALYSGTWQSIFTSVRYMRKVLGLEKKRNKCLEFNLGAVAILRTEVVEPPNNVVFFTDNMNERLEKYLSAEGDWPSDFPAILEEEGIWGGWVIFA